MFFEHDRHEHWRRTIALARERECEPFVGRDLGEHAFAWEVSTVEGFALRALHDDAEDAARTRIELTHRCREVLWREPLSHLLWIGPCLEHQLARRVEYTSNNDAPLRRDNAISFGHASRPPPVVRGDARRDDRGFAPKRSGIAPSISRPRADDRP